MNPARVVDEWLAAVNAHDVARLTALAGPDFLFVDSLGNRVNGANAMDEGWRRYFAMCPDYWVRVDHVVSEGATLLLAGEAGGTIDDTSWRIPAAWKVVIRGDRLSEWRVFADNRPVYEILARRR